MGINAARLCDTEVKDWSPEDVASFLSSLDGKEFDLVACLCAQKGVDGQESVLCIYDLVSCFNGVFVI